MRLVTRHRVPVLISLNAYQTLEDAWTGGVEAWCRAASGFVLNGGRAWLVTVSDGQANWVKRRLLRAGVPLFGVQFLDARALRRELCQWFGLPARTLGQETLEFLLRLRALAAAGEGSPRCGAVARHPGTCLAALDDYAAAGWLHEPGLLDEILPEELAEFLPELRRLGAWTPEIDRELRREAESRRRKSEDGRIHHRDTETGKDGEGEQERRRETENTQQVGKLSVCVFGWDAGWWPRFDLMRAAAWAADAAYVFAPSPRGTSEGVQQGWMEACEEAFSEAFEACEASGFVGAQAALAGRLEGTDLDAATDEERPAAPELLTGEDGEDLAALTVDFVARWLVEAEKESEGAAGQRMVLLCPRRTPTAVTVVRALAAAGISVEDELGEIAEPGLAVQIQRAILEYQQDRNGLDGLLTLVELLNQHAAESGVDGKATVLREVFPLDPVEVRRVLHGAFAEVQHHDAGALCHAAAFARAEVGKPLRRLITHLEAWPETLPWGEALRRWGEGLAGLDVSIDSLEPLWSQLQSLVVPDPVPAAAFFEYLSRVLACSPARRPAGSAHRFARVVVTTLEGAAGQSWDGVVLLDSNEGQWPLYPAENPFFDDAVRARFNVRRTEFDGREGEERPHHLLTSADRAQLEHFRFLETLENCTGPLAFGSLTRDAVDAGRELYPNEWLLRCLVESDASGAQDEALLERWRRSLRKVVRAGQPLAPTERAQLELVHRRRRDPEVPFDEYFFNFQALTGPDELPWAEAWSAGELDAAWNQPATFAMAQVFAALPWRDKARGLVRGESWMVGRLVHQWVPAALGLSKEARRFGAEDWQRAFNQGLARVRGETEASLHNSLGAGKREKNGAAELNLWWQGVLRKAHRATHRCLEALAELAMSDGQAERWVSVERNFRGELATGDGLLRLRARCDLVLLDRPEMAGANCQLIDIRTGAAPGSGPLTLAKAQTGKGLGLAALVSMARAEGANAHGTQAGVIHPERSNFALVDEESAPMLQPALDLLAREQGTLVFGQRGAVVDESGHGSVENLPLATTPVDPAVLAQKGRLTAACH